MAAVRDELRPAPAAGAPGTGSQSAARHYAPLGPPVGARPPSLIDRVRARLLAGATTQSIAAGEGISPALAEIMVDDLQRRGLAATANSLCASGLGACAGGTGDDVRIHCAGCPLVPLRAK